MKRLGIVLDFNNEDITIDEIALPMRDISNLPLSKKKGLDSVTLPSYRNQIAVRRQLSA
jgi:hypothetical protein